jgi:hypothetical protein
MFHTPPRIMKSALERRLIVRHDEAGSARGLQTHRTETADT